MARVLNDNSQWREFERNDVTHSAAHYLMAIDTLRQKYGYARVTDVADLLEVSRGAASMSLSTLKKRNWVAEDPNRFLLLTEEGERIAYLVENNFKILSKFFEEILGVSPQVAMADACKMEHLVSLETGRRMVWLMRYMLSNPRRANEVQQAMSCFRDGCESVEHCPMCESEADCLDVSKACAYKEDATVEE
ncbi:MAG: metal-dependent transcriptional regulator [FCB group bacterium]|jgi:Mn-dependent DtxR family transcriptional regulator|nr:metal-dependent transcriptional regulator [FCB group bacterium]